MGADETAVAFLQAKQVSTLACGLKFQNLLTDVFEAGEHLDELDAVSLRNGICHVGRHDTLHQGSVRWKLAACHLFSLADLIICQQTAGHISGEGMIFTGFRILHVDTQPVRIGIGSQHQIGVHFLCQLQSQRKCLCGLRVRIADRRELAVRQLLLRHHVHVLEADLPQHSACRDVAGAVQRCVYNADILLGCINGILMDHLAFQLCDIRIIDIAADVLVQTGRLCRSLVHGFHLVIIRHRAHLCHNAGVVGRGDLCAVLPVYLVTVVFRRVVAGGDVDACDAVQLTHRIGKLRCGAQRFKHIRPDAVGRQTKCCLVCKFRRHSSGIKSDGHAALLSVHCADVVRQSLGRLAYGINVHAVRSCTDHAPQSCGSEFQICVKTLADLVIIIGNGAKLLLRRLIKIRVLKPVVVCLSVVHWYYLPVIVHQFCGSPF